MVAWRYGFYLVCLLVLKIATLTLERSFQQSKMKSVSLRAYVIIFSFYQNSFISEAPTDAVLLITADPILKALLAIVLLKYNEIFKAALV